MKIKREEWIIQYNKGDKFLKKWTFKHAFYARLPYPKGAILLNFILFFGSIGMVVYQAVYGLDLVFMVGRIPWHLRTINLYILVYSIIQLRTSVFYGTIKAQFLGFFAILGSFGLYDFFHLLQTITNSDVLTSSLWFNNMLQICMFLVAGYLFYISIKPFYKINYMLLSIIFSMYISIWFFRITGRFVFTEYMGFWHKYLACIIMQVMVLKEND